MNALNNASIKDENCTGLASFAFPKAKSSRTGVSVEYIPVQDKQWYVFRIKYGKAQTVADAIIEDGTYVYLAQVWKDVVNKETGKKQRKLFPFMNLLFAYVTDQEAEKYVKDSPQSRYTTYYYNHFVTDAQGKNPPLTIAQKDMWPLIKATALLDEHVMAGAGDGELLRALGERRKFAADVLRQLAQEQINFFLQIPRHGPVERPRGEQIEFVFRAEQPHAVVLFTGI